MPDLAEVIVEDGRWNEIGISGLADRAARAALSAAGIEPSLFSVAILACGDDRIAALNADFRHQETSTNVLSWPAIELASETAGGIPGQPPLTGHGSADTGLGDIAIAFDTCRREAGERDIPLGDHAFHLIVHGCLHLLGYDHIDDADATVMESLEVKALATEGIPNPY